MAVSIVRKTVRDETAWGGARATEVDTTFEGAVLETRERNGYDDSDFYAIVWDDEKGCCREVEYATTRGWTYLNSATIDATDEVREKAAKWYAGVVLERARWLADDRAAAIERGKYVRVTRKYRSRKLGVTLEKGTVGRALADTREFGNTYAEKYGRAVGRRWKVRFEEGDLWLSDTDLEVADTAAHLEWDEDSERERAEATARSVVVGRAGSLAGYFSPGWFVM